MASLDISASRDRKRLRVGYDCEFVDPPPAYFETECSICLHVLRSSHITSCCGKYFCKECIERVQKDQKSCPLCNVKEYSMVYNRTHDVSLKQFEVYCTQKKTGCQWTGKLETLDNHLDSCQFVEVECCHAGCKQSFQRRLIGLHQDKECCQRLHTCSHCKGCTSTYQDISTNHWPVCKEYPVSCPNACGTLKVIKRKHLEKHLNTNCPLQEVACDFHYAGCETKLLRKDMPDHVSKLEEMVRHMSLLAQQNQKLSTELRMLKCHMKVHIAPVEFVMTNFLQHKRDGDKWLSEEFYTHPRGYKLCLGVFANGTSTAKGTHVSCFVYRVRGEFDDDLTWPFRGVITFEALNQLGDRNHRCHKATFDDKTPLKHVCRVTSGERSKEGWGKISFLPHHALDPVLVKDTKYLMNDCLRFRVQAELH